MCPSGIELARLFLGLDVFMSPELLVSLVILGGRPLGLGLLLSELSASLHNDLKCKI